MKLLCRDGEHEVKVRFNPAPGERFCPEHGCALVSLPKAMKALQPKPRDRLPGEKAARFNFVRVVKANPCFFLDTDEFGERRRPEHTCTYPLQAHHLLPKSWLRRELTLPPEEIVELIWNPLIGAPLCKAAHHLVEVGTDHVYWEELNPDLIAFCERFDAAHPDQRLLLHRLQLESPERSAA